MKQSFALEIEVPEVENIYFVPFILEGMLSEKLIDIYGKSIGLVRVKVEKQTAEQTCGTPENTNKMIDLLNEAAETIARLSDKLSDAKAYALGLDIEKHLRDNV